MSLISSPSSCISSHAPSSHHLILCSLCLIPQCLHPYWFAKTINWTFLSLYDATNSPTILFLFDYHEYGSIRFLCSISKISPINMESFTIVWPCIITDSLWIKPTDALNSNFIGITTLHVSGSLSAHQELLAVYRLWYIINAVVMNRLLPGVWWNCLQFHPTPGSKRSQLHKMYQSRCTAKNSWWAERLPKTWVVIPIKLEFIASVGFIHKQHGVISQKTVTFSLCIASERWQRQGKRVKH